MWHSKARYSVSRGTAVVVPRREITPNSNSGRRDANPFALHAEQSHRATIAHRGGCAANRLCGRGGSFNETRAERDFCEFERVQWGNVTRSNRGHKGRGSYRGDAYLIMEVIWYLMFESFMDISCLNHLRMAQGCVSGRFIHKGLILSLLVGIAFFNYLVVQ